MFHCICSEEDWIDLRLLYLESFVCKVSSCLASRNVNSKQFPTLIRSFFLNDKGGSLCLHCTNNMIDAEHLLSSWSRVLVMLGRRWLFDQPPVKSWLLNLCWACLIDNTWQVLSQWVAGGIKLVCCASLGREFLGAYVLWASPHVPFPLAGVCVLSPVSPFSRSLNLEGGLRDSWFSRMYFFFPWSFLEQILSMEYLGVRPQHN